MTSALSFEKQFGRDQILLPKKYHSNEIFSPPLTDQRGQYITCSDSTQKNPLKTIITERLNNSYELSNNEAALVFHNAKRYNKSTKQAIGDYTPLHSTPLHFILDYLIFCLFRDTK